MTQAEYNEHIDDIKNLEYDYNILEDFKFLCTVFICKDKQKTIDLLFLIRDKIPKYAAIPVKQERVLFYSNGYSLQKNREIRIEFLNDVLALHKQGKLLDLINS